MQRVRRKADAPSGETREWGREQWWEPEAGFVRARNRLAGLGGRGSGRWCSGRDTRGPGEGLEQTRAKNQSAASPAFTRPAWDGGSMRKLKRVGFGGDGGWAEAALSVVSVWPASTGQGRKEEARGSYAKLSGRDGLRFSPWRPEATTVAGRSAVGSELITLRFAVLVTFTCRRERIHGEQLLTQAAVP